MTIPWPWLHTRRGMGHEAPPPFLICFVTPVLVLLRSPLHLEAPNYLL